MDEQMNQQAPDDWLRSSMQRAAAVTTKPDFKQRVLRELKNERLASAKRMRRVSVVVLCVGIALVAVAVATLLAMNPSQVQSHITQQISTPFSLPASSLNMQALPFSLQATSPIAMAGGFLLLVLLGLAAWEWLDRTV